MMRKRALMKYHKGWGYKVVMLPYVGNDLHFVLLVPNSVGGLAGLEKRLSSKLLMDCAAAEQREVILEMPKFKISAPTLSLSGDLKKMGMGAAFDEPGGSADFDAMAPRRGDEKLVVSDVLHKTFIEVDEKGTEAAAATAVLMAKVVSVAPQGKPPVEVVANRPFVFAIQHAGSGACLFLGRVNDPRGE
jgi:serpin B